MNRRAGNKRSLVTGASRTIGKAFVLALADKGFDVAASGRTVNHREIHDNGPGVRARSHRPAAS